MVQSVMGKSEQQGVDNLGVVSSPPLVLSSPKGFNHLFTLVFQGQPPAAT